jgi:hypothetical protein
MIQIVVGSRSILDLILIASDFPAICLDLTTPSFSDRPQTERRKTYHLLTRGANDLLLQNNLFPPATSVHPDQVTVFPTWGAAQRTVDLLTFNDGLSLLFLASCDATIQYTKCAVRCLPTFRRERTRYLVPLFYRETRIEAVLLDVFDGPPLQLGWSARSMVSLDKIRV